MADSNPFPATTRRQVLSALASALQDRPIESGDPRYYAFHDSPGEPRGRDPIREIRSLIEIQNDQGICQLFSGFRGSGKSTELRRLQSELTERGFTVLFIQGAAYINTNQPLETADLLVSVAAAVAEQVFQRTKHSPERGNVLKQLQRFFKDTHIDLHSLDLDTGFAKIGLQLSRDISFKNKIQTTLRDRLPDFARQFNDFMQEVKTILGIVDVGLCPVLIIDDLEKVRGSFSNADLVQRSIEEIFAQFSWALRIKGWHTVWTAPPYLQLLNNAIPSEYDNCAVLPMVRLWHRNPLRAQDLDGMSAMRSCLRLRGDVEGLVESPALLDKVILASSGHLRDLIRLVRDLVIEANISSFSKPLDEQTVQRVLEDYMQGYRQAVYDEDIPWLRRVADSREISVPDMSMVQRAAKLLDTAMVMTYRNGSQWFDIHAAIRAKLASPGAPVVPTPPVVPVQITQP